MYAGTGVYTLSEAARLIRAPARSIGRWLYGYAYARNSGDGRREYQSSALWTPQYSFADYGERVIGFRDLLELRVVREFVAHGVPLLVVRRCLDTAKQLFAKDYPFNTNRFATDGRTIFLDVLRQGSEKEMIDLRGRQLVFRDIIKPSLYAGIEYERGFARRWFPEVGKQRNIVIDPLQQFGKPMVTGDAVPTEALFANYLAEGATSGAIGVVARIYELPARKVAAAVRFEEALRHAG